MQYYLHRAARITQEIERRGRKMHRTYFMVRAAKERRRGSEATKIVRRFGFNGRLHIETGSHTTCTEAQRLLIFVSLGTFQPT